MEKKPQPKNREYAALLSPMTVIRKNHLSKKDVNRIKRHLSAKTAFTSLIVAFVTFALGLGIFLYESISTNWSQTAVYGINAVIGQVIIIVGSLITILLYFAAKPHLHDHYGRVLTRMCNDVLLVSISLLVIFSIFADAQAGFTTEGRAVSAAMLIICLMLLIQPAYWVDAIVIDVLFSAGVITVAIICANIFGMNEIAYYIIVAALYPGVCYLVDIRSFYAETQHYCQTLISERLYDSSNYDELTHCKNRTALSRYLSENEQEEATNHLYLMLLFDVDNFKEYNDQFSHLAGDHCLRSVAEAVRKSFPSPNLDFFRYGGDEFLMMFEIADPQDAKEMALRLKEAIYNLKMKAPKGAPDEFVTISIGGAVFPSLGKRSFEDDLKIVDKHLYKAKQNGKNQACLEGKIL